MGEAVNKICFVVGPIGEDESDVRLDADWLLEEIITPAFADAPEFSIKRADKLAQPGLIDSQVIGLLLTADLVIADLSHLNPNAFYEIGIRHMAQMPIIHMFPVGLRLPFDNSTFRSISFSRASPADLRSARAQLKSQIEATLAPEFEVENPVTRARGRIKIIEHATSEQRLFLDSLDEIRGRLQMIEKTLELKDSIRIDYDPTLPPTTPIIKAQLDRPVGYMEIRGASATLAGLFQAPVSYGPDGNSIVIRTDLRPSAENLKTIEAKLRAMSGVIDVRVLG